jgi:hypothetical protein
MTNEELKAAFLELANATPVAERDGAEPFHGRHLEPGLVRYDEIVNASTGQKGVTLLLEKETIDAMRPTMRGLTVTRRHEVGVKPSAIADGDGKGMAVAGFWNGDDAWEHVDFFVWDKETKAECRNGFELSCAFVPNDGGVDWTPGKKHNVPYDGVIKSARYTHLAVVPNPRYKGAVIFANSKGGVPTMKINLFGLGKTEGVTLEKDVQIDVDGKKRTVLELVNALAASDAAAAAVTAPKIENLKDDDVIEIDGKKRTLGELKNALRAADKVVPPAAEPKPSDALKPKPAEKITMTSEEFENALKERLDKAVEDLKGHAFFNAVAAIAKVRPDSALDTEPKRRTEKDRVKEGKARYGKAAAEAAAK